MNTKRLMMNSKNKGNIFLKWFQKDFYQKVCKDCDQVKFHRKLNKRLIFLKSLHPLRKDYIPDFIKLINQIPYEISAKSIWEGVRKTSKGSAVGGLNT